MYRLSEAHTLTPLVRVARSQSTTLQASSGSCGVPQNRRDEKLPTMSTKMAASKAHEHRDTVGYSDNKYVNNGRNVCIGTIHCDV